MEMGWFVSEVGRNIEIYDCGGASRFDSCTHTIMKVLLANTSGEESTHVSSCLQ